MGCIVAFTIANGRTCELDEQDVEALAIALERRSRGPGTTVASILRRALHRANSTHRIRGIQTPALYGALREMTATQQSSAAVSALMEAMRVEQARRLGWNEVTVDVRRLNA